MRCGVRAAILDATSEEEEEALRWKPLNNNPQMKEMADRLVDRVAASDSLGTVKEDISKSHHLQAIKTKRMLSLTAPRTTKLRQQTPPI